MSKIKLLKIFPSTIRGGVEEYALKMASAAVGKGWDVHVAFPSRARTTTLRDDFSKIGACCHTLEIPAEARGIIPFLIKVVRTLTLLLKIKPDAVQLSLPFPDQCLASMTACALLKIPAIVVFQLVAEGVGVGCKQLSLYHWARKRNQQWISISENNRELLSELFHLPKNDIALVYNGPCFSSDNDLKNCKTTISRDVRNELGLSCSDSIILTVGRLHQQKGYAYIIPAIPHILKKHPAIRFVWVGEGEQRSELESLVKEYEVESNVLFLGYRTDIPRLLLASDLFLFPTLYEGGSSMALLEAMEYCLPIVASGASGIPEVIEDTVHGLLFRKADSCSLLMALHQALDHPAKMEEMAVNASMRAKEFSYEKMTDNTLGLLDALVCEKCQTLS